MKTVAVRAEDIDFEAAAREHRSFLLQIAVASTRNATDAEDIVQEALLRGYRGLKRFRGDCPLRIWLSRIVVRVSINHHRSVARRLKRWVFFADLQAVYEDGSVQESEPPDPAGMFDHEALIDIRKEVAALKAIDPLINRHFRRQLETARRPRVVNRGRVFGLSTATAALVAILAFVVVRVPQPNSVAPLPAQPVIAPIASAEPPAPV